MHTCATHHSHWLADEARPHGEKWAWASMALPVGGTAASLPEIAILSSMPRQKAVTAFAGTVRTLAIVGELICDMMLQQARSTAHAAMASTGSAIAATGAGKIPDNPSISQGQLHMRKIHSLFRPFQELCPYTHLWRVLRTAIRQRRLPASSRPGAMIALMGLFCPIFWVALLTGASKEELLFHGSHSAIVFVVGLLLMLVGMKASPPGSTGSGDGDSKG